MFVYIESLLLIVIEVFCCKIFFNNFSEKRYAKKIFYYIAFVIQVIYTYLISLILNQSLLLKELLVVIGISIIMYFIMQINVLKAVCLATLYQGLLVLIDYFILWLNVIFFNSIKQVDEIYYVQGNLLVTLGKIIIFIVVILIGKYIGNKSLEKLTNIQWVQFMIFPIFTIVSISAMIISTGNIENQQQGDIYLSIAICLVGMNILVFYLINNILDREMQIRKSKIFELEVKSQLSMYRSISENLNNHRRRTHEYKNQIMCIQGLINKKNYQDLKTYIDKISGNFVMQMDNIDTNNSIVDAIFNTKYQEMLQKNINFVFKINDLSNIKISDEDIVTILSNLFNNAIEACEKCVGKKVIKAKFIKEKYNIIIAVKNTYNGDLIVKDENIFTSKEEKEEHGIGIKNIIYVVEKYNGSYSIKTNGKEFYFSIIIPV